MKSNRFILGTVQFGLHYGINNTNGQPSNGEVSDIFHCAYDNGLKQLDTADAYGDAQSLIGSFIETTGKSFEINTKFHVSNGHTISAQLIQALDKLKVDHIHTYFYHRFEDLRKEPNTLVELKSLRDQKKINKIGVSVYSNGEFEASINTPEIDVIQFPFNLLDNYTKRGVLMQRAKLKGKELQVRSIFLQGLFFKTDALPEVIRPLTKYLSSLKEMASSNNLSMFDLALGYALSKEEIDSVIIGVDTKEQLAVNLTSSEKALNQSLISNIDSIDVKEEALLYPYNWK